MRSYKRTSKDDCIRRTQAFVIVSHNLPNFKTELFIKLKSFLIVGLHMKICFPDVAVLACFKQRLLQQPASYSHASVRCKHSECDDVHLGSIFMRLKAACYSANKDIIVVS